MAVTIYITGFPGPAGVLDFPDTRQFPISESTETGGGGTDPGGGGADEGLTIAGQRGYAYLLRYSPPGLTPIYVAASFGRSTTPTDTPANTYVPGKLAAAPNFGVQLFDGIEPGNGGGGSLGVITIVDPNGELDGLISRTWDGGLLEILRGPVLAEFSTYSVVAKLSGAGIIYDQRKKQIRCRDLGWQLEQSNVHDEAYGGSGGEDGDPAMAGQWKPYAAGAVFNVAPPLITAATLIYQLSCTAINGVSAVRDGGVALTFSANYSDYATLAAATVPSSNYATCLALGLIRLGSAAVYAITCDFTGDSETISGQTYPSTRAQVARRIAIGRGAITLTDAQIDSTSLANLESDQPSAVGFYWPDRISKAQALTEVMIGCLGYWLVGLDGKLKFGQLEAPIGTAAIAFNYPEDFGAREPEMPIYQVPRRATYVGYRRNYAQQGPSQLAGVVSQADAVIYAQRTRYGLEYDYSVTVFFPTSQPVYVDGGFLNEVDATAEALRQQNLMNVRHERWRITIYMPPFTDVLGKIIQINNFPRFGWAASRKFLCVGVSFTSGLSVTLDLWG